METYKVDCECTNCDHKGHVELPKGTPVAALMQCPNCGCVTATKKQVKPVVYREPIRQTWRDPNIQFGTLVVGPPMPGELPRNAPTFSPHRLDCTQVTN